MNLTSTKIVCTIGPASNKKEKLLEIANAGMSVARLNFSHGSYEDHKKVFDIIREVEEEIGRPLAILQYLSGPKIRIGNFQNPPVLLHPGADFKIIAGSNIVGDESQIGCNYIQLSDDVEPGNVILLSDGAIELEVIEVKHKEINCKVIIGGELSNHKGINLKSGTLKAPALTEKDKKDLDFGLKIGMDLVALSFVRSADDIREVKQIMKNHNRNVPVIAKIERQEALQYLDEIIDASEGIMVARGDLGVEVEIADVPLLQKEIIHKCNKVGKTVIVATQMLKSMVEE